MDERSEPVDYGLKRSTNLTLKSRLVRDARQLGINLSAAAEDGIERAVAKARDQQWVERNRGAMASYDAFVEREGLLLEDLRTF
jgi:antitoxin CcdA